MFSLSMQATLCVQRWLLTAVRKSLSCSFALLGAQPGGFNAAFVLLFQFFFFFFFCCLQTGYMFGKGIYFADMVSKSANYCHTSQADPIGLILLGEVALGNM